MVKEEPRYNERCKLKMSYGKNDNTRWKRSQVLEWIAMCISDMKWNYPWFKEACCDIMLDKREGFWDEMLIIYMWHDNSWL